MIIIILSLNLRWQKFSFDVVSDFERQELVNTLDQVKISQRYDLKGTDTKVDLDQENIL